jgi:hypothetical protein
MYDTNPKDKQIPTSELMAQAAMETKTQPNVVARIFVSNPDTLGFVKTILGAAPKVNGKTAKKTTVRLNGPGKDAEYFEMLLGSDNSRGVQRMLNDHPSYF